MCPSSVLGNLMLLLGNGISSPSQQSSVVGAEVLHILSVLTNYSHEFAEEVLKQDICSLLRQMVLGMDTGSMQLGSAQASSGLIRVLALVASLLPSVILTENGCICEEHRLAVYKNHPEFLEALTDAFTPMLMDICQASMDPAVQSICISLLLTFVLASPERQKRLEPSQLAGFLASLLLTEPSSSVTLSCLLVTEQMLVYHASDYALSFIRQGVLHAVQRIAAREVAPEAPKADIASTNQAGRVVRRLCIEVAQRVKTQHFASDCPVLVLRQLQEVAGQLQADPQAALERLRLLLGDSVTAFELTSSGLSGALAAFLFPEGCDEVVCRERLRLFLEQIVAPPGGALLKLVKLCVSALQRAEQQPLMLFPTQACPAMYLPRHLWLATLPAQREVDGMRLGSRSSGASSPLLSVLRLLAKPVKIRMSPRGGVLGSSLPNFKSLLPFGSFEGPPEARNKAMAKPGAVPGRGAPRGAGQVSASPAARLRNYLASKVACGLEPKRGAGRECGYGRRTQKFDFSLLGSLVLVSRMEQNQAGTSGQLGAASVARGGREGGLAKRPETFLGVRAEDSSGSREQLTEALETVLLVEPFAQVSALEDYIFERHGSKASEQPGDGTGSEPARVRLNSKQPPPQPKARAKTQSGDLNEARSDAGASSPMPLDPALPQGASMPSVADKAERKPQVKIFYNGHQLTAKESVVQVLVHNAKRAAGVEEPSRARQSRRTVGGRFLASMEESSGSEGEGFRASRHFCGSIWSRVHHMTFELDATSPREGEAAKAEDDKLLVRWAREEPQVDPPVMMVSSDMEWLVQCHLRVKPTIDGVCGGGAASDAAGSGDHETAATMLKLLSAFHNISLYSRGMEADANSDDFFCNALTSALLRQLSDPLAVCTGSVPSWCTKLAGACRFLFPFHVRRILHHSCNLGLGRALHHVQQRAVAQHAHSQEAHRRLESEVSVASVPRQKVRISRQRLLESAVKVMNLYSAGNALLEIEYVGEVGTGSGPTLEFYAQVAESLRTTSPTLFRSGTPGNMLFPEPYDPHWLRRADDQAAQQILERWRLLGQIVAKCIIDNRLVDIQLHPAFWRSVLGTAPLSHDSLRAVDPELHNSLSKLRDMDDLESLCLSFTLPGHSEIELKPGGGGVNLTSANRDQFLARAAEVSLVEAVAPQVNAFRSAFKELLPLETCRIWSEQELSCIIMGASVMDDSFWNLEHLSANIKAQHGYTADSRCFTDLLTFLSDLSPDNRRNFLMFATGAPTLPLGGFGGLKPPLTVVKKEAPPAPLTADNFMPSVMTCANYLKLPEYSSCEILKQKLELAMQEGQCAFLLS
ncbi:unnamed protein product [Effrenium voratum]|nr:unnamed protein product [Effrenium voratum]